MRHFGKKVLSGLFAFVMIFTLFCTSASAGVYSSAYLNSYRAGVTPKSGEKIVVTVDVTGVGYMPELGAKTIQMYESQDGANFTRVKTYRSSAYPKMMGSGTSFYEDVITHQGTAGYYYYARVTVYAGNENGSDERTFDTPAVRAIA